MENLFKSIGVKHLNCSGCGKAYPISEFYEIAAEVGKPGVELPPYADLLKCVECWRLKYPKKVKGE